jgi:2-polyprenyl-3-methyl-5-hydroxy-6-metoxy-1,4-benzoquinol methylase
VDELSLGRRSSVSWPIVRCRACGLVRVDPHPVLDATRDIYEGDAYGFVRSSQADDFGGDGIPYAQRVLTELESLGSGGRLLDLGCATGDFLLAARERGWQPLGVELSAHAAAVARRRGLEVRVGTLAEANFGPASFDAVTMLDVIEHLSDPLAELREVHRLLRPGGILCVETPNWDSVYRRLLGRRWAALQPRLHLLYFDRRTAAKVLRRAGFEPVITRTETVALLSPEGSARGFGSSSIRGLLRDAMVRVLLRLAPGPWDRFFLRIGPAARVNAAAGSFKRLASTEVPDRRPNTARSSTRIAVVRAINRPLDLLCLKLGMGEQLRIVAKRRGTPPPCPPPEGEGNRKARESQG